MDFEEVDYWDESGRDHGVVKDPCDLYFLPVLGRTGGAILSLRYQKGDLWTTKIFGVFEHQGA